MPKQRLQLADLGALLQSPPQRPQVQPEPVQVQPSPAPMPGHSLSDRAPVQHPSTAGPEQTPAPAPRPAPAVRANHHRAPAARPAPAPPPSDLPPELLALKISSQPTSRAHLAAVVTEAWGEVLDPDRRRPSGWGWEQTRAYQLLWGRLD